MTMKWNNITEEGRGTREGASSLVGYKTQNQEVEDENYSKKIKEVTMRDLRAPLLIISTVIKTVTISLSSQNSLTVGAFNFVKISSSLAL